MVIEKLSKAIKLKKKVERKLFLRHILPMMVVVYVIIFPVFYFIIFVKCNIGILLIIPLTINIVIAWAIRYVWLKACFGNELKIFNGNNIEITPDIKFIEFTMFCHELSDDKDLISNRDNIISKINEELIASMASLSEHKFSIISAGTILAIFANAISYILQQAFPVTKISDTTNYFIFVVIVCFLLIIPWGISKGFLDQFSNKKRLRELREYLEWMPVLKKMEN